MVARSSDIAAVVMGFGVLVAVMVRMRVIRIGVMRIAYAPVFGIPRADVGGADFLMGIPFHNDCISAYCIHFFAYVA